MELNLEAWENGWKQLDGKKVEYRVCRNVVYVKKPVCPKYQQMNIYVPEPYFHDNTVNGYRKYTAPIFMPNTVGGYISGALRESDTIFYALSRGYVVVLAAVRGRELKNEQGENIGKAPALVTDMKAAVRFIKWLGDGIPGDKEKIITSGASAGGALSAIMGATGDHKDYDKYLTEIGAYDTSDKIWMASCYCPIINMENSDMAYEWQFNEVYDFHRKHMNMNEGGRPYFTSVDGVLTEKEKTISKELAKAFPKYANSLSLKENGRLLTLEEDGTGTLLEYIKEQLLKSAQKELDKGKTIQEEWLTIRENQAVMIDYGAYIKAITRMKNVPAFDSLEMDHIENDEFGTKETDKLHFTQYAYENSQVGGKLASRDVIKMMNPMCYLSRDNKGIAKHYRIRHGSIDRDTALVISAMFALKLSECGSSVDYEIPWGIPHSGDYDLEELFDYIDKM